MSKKPNSKKCNTCAVINNKLRCSMCKYKTKKWAKENLSPSLVFDSKDMYRPKEEEQTLRTTNYGMLTSSKEQLANEAALQYIADVYEEFYGPKKLEDGDTAITHKLILDLLKKLFDKYNPTIIDIARFMKHVREEQE